MQIDDERKQEVENEGQHHVIGLHQEEHHHAQDGHPNLALPEELDLAVALGDPGGHDHRENCRGDAGGKEHREQRRGTVQVVLRVVRGDGAANDVADRACEADGAQDHPLVVAQQ